MMRWNLPAVAGLSLGFVFGCAEPVMPPEPPPTAGTDDSETTPPFVYTTDQTDESTSDSGAVIGGCDDDERILRYADADSDGFGDPYVTSMECPDAQGWVDNIDDCDDTNGSISPNAIDVCADGIDQNCDGVDHISDGMSCESILIADPAAESGAYCITPTEDPYASFMVYCDMTTDGGGWTLVSSTYDQPPDDQRIDYHVDLSSLTPGDVHAGVWDGMIDFIGIDPLTPLVDAPRHDLRFACKADVNSGGFDVDLSFYDVFWYAEITRPTDEDSCFNETDGLGQDPTPERRNNLNGETRTQAMGYTGQYTDCPDDWPTPCGVFEGEDSCADAFDFTVDFEDRGMDGIENDGTDWGEDDGVQKCGGASLDFDGGWFIFVRANDPTDT